MASQIFCLLLLFSKGVLGCPNGWSVADDLCLSFFSESKNWNDARDACASKQGHLVKVESEKENSALVNFRLAQKQQGDPVWMGLNRTVTGKWQWYDGTPVTWSAWQNGEEPSNTALQCGALKTSGGGTVVWDQWSCEMPLAHICQWADSKKETTPEDGFWVKLSSKGRYSGSQMLLNLTSLSRLHCVTRCQNTANCNAVDYQTNGTSCNMISETVWTNQITPAENWEVWVKRE